MSLLPTLLAGAGGGGGGSGSVTGIILAPTVAATTSNLPATYANGSAGQGATLTSGLTNLTAARVATTGALTVTQAGAGVGATLTNNGAQAAISIDGVALSLNDRVLVKQQAAASQNGVYSVTTVGTGATNWVLTRVTDFDQAAEMVAGTEIGVTAGTVNAGTLWILAATVTTPDTTACTFNAAAAFAIDGISPTVGQRVLVKNQTSALQNGVYTVTTVGSSSVLWVLTRASDFNQPSQMTAGTLVEVISGSVNAGTVWELNASVAAVGTNNVTFISINITTKVDQNGSPIYGLDSVGTDSYAITLSPAPSSYTIGMVLRFTAGTANTGTASLNVNGLGAKTIVKNFNATLANNDILAGQEVEVIYDGTNFQMLSPTANTSNISVIPFQNMQAYTSGTNTFTTPAYSTQVFVRIWGGGGGGGGSVGGSFGSGGGGGGYAEGFVNCAASTGYTVTVGAAGTGGAAGANDGVDGGTSSAAFVSTIQATGGAKGVHAGGAGGAGGSGSGGNTGALNLTGHAGDGGGGTTGGYGGDAALGGTGGYVYALTGVTSAGATPGGGGAGGTNGTGGTNGGAGLVIVYY